MSLCCITCWFCTDILTKEETKRGNKEKIIGKAREGENKKEIERDVMNILEPCIIWRHAAFAWNLHWRRRAGRFRSSAACRLYECIDKGRGDGEASDGDKRGGGQSYYLI